MGRMTPHEILINTLCSTVLNLVPTISSPVAPSGELMLEFNYKIKLPEFSETIGELLKTKGAKVPDLLLVNEEQKLFVVVECKSDFSLETQERLPKQLEFYSSNVFRTISEALFKDLKELEIWIFIEKSLSFNVVSFIKVEEQKLNLANTVVWAVEYKKVGEEAEITKVYGKHIDNRLNKRMEGDGLKCSPPQIEILLIDPTLTYSERVFRIGRRILAFMASTYLTEEERTISIQKFRERYLDAIITDIELKKCFRYLTAFIPEIGQYDSVKGEIILNKRPSLDKIKAKLERIQGMTDLQFKTELAYLRKGLPKLRIKKTRPTPLEYSLDKWIKKKNIKIDKQVRRFSDITFTLDSTKGLYETEIPRII